MEKLIDKSVLPQTWAEIQAQFADTDLCCEVWAAARTGGVMGLARRVALTASGLTGLAEVQAVLSREWAEQGLHQVYVGEADPGVYGPDQVAAYLDQPVEGR